MIYDSTEYKLDLVSYAIFINLKHIPLSIREYKKEKIVKG